MEFNVASTSPSPSSTASARCTIVDGFKIPDFPLAGPSQQPAIGIQAKKPRATNMSTEVLIGLPFEVFSVNGKHDEMENSESLSEEHSGISQDGKAVYRVFEVDFFPSPDSEDTDDEATDEAHYSRPSVGHKDPQPLPRAAAPSPAPSTLPQISSDIDRMYVLEAKQCEEIRRLATGVLAAVYKVGLSAPGAIVQKYRQHIADLLGDGVERCVVMDAEELKREGKVPGWGRRPAWDFGSLERCSAHSEADEGAEELEDAIPQPVRVSPPATSNKPSTTMITSRKRQREEDSYEDVLEVEKSPSRDSVSSSEDVPPLKRPRLDGYESKTDNYSEEDAILGIIWAQYFDGAEGDMDDEEYSPSENTSERASDDGSDSEVDEEDISFEDLTRGLPEELKRFIEEAAAFNESSRLAEEAVNRSVNLPPPSSSCDPFSLGTAEERPPAPAPRPNPPAPRRLQRSNARLMIDEDGGISVVDYTMTEEYQERLRLERESMILNERCGFDNRSGPCDLLADLREIAQVAPNGDPLSGTKWRFRFDEQAWRDFEIPPWDTLG